MAPDRPPRGCEVAPHNDPQSDHLAHPPYGLSIRPSTRRAPDERVSVLPGALCPAARRTRRRSAILVRTSRGNSRAGVEDAIPKRNGCWPGLLALENPPGARRVNIVSATPCANRKSVWSGKRWSERVNTGGRR